MNSERAKHAKTELKTARRTITDETERWSSSLDLAFPIDPRDIPNFDRWVEWNGFGQRHQAHDIAAYMDSSERCVLGLPGQTPVRAVADGKVVGIATQWGYATAISVQHSRHDSIVQPAGLVSVYIHADSLVVYGQEVKKGEVIARLYKDKGEEEGRLVHLHLELMYEESIIKMGRADPLNVFPELIGPRAEPQHSTEFTVIGADGKNAEIFVANFRTLRVS